MFRFTFFGHTAQMSSVSRIGRTCMKKCTYCGKEFPDDTKACAFDGEPLGRVGANGVAEAPVSEESLPDPPARAMANRNMLVGGLWCVGGILVTGYTLAASSGPGGGTYVVAWGAILFGGIQFFRGLLSR
jgi:hypothetical protein